MFQVERKIKILEGEVEIAEVIIVPGETIEFSQSCSVVMTLQGLRDLVAQIEKEYV